MQLLFFSAMIVFIALFLYLLKVDLRYQRRCPRCARRQAVRR